MQKNKNFKRKNYGFYIFLIFQFIFSVDGIAQGSGSVKGRVLDNETGEPLPAANIMIKNTSLGTTSDKDGKFNMPKVPVGKWTVKVSYIGYASVTREITIFNDTTVEQEFRLKTEVVYGQQIVVTAQASGQIAAINLQLTSDNIANMVSSARIQELPDANAAESVGRLPGVALVRSGGQATQVVIRGLQPKYNTITIDGVAIPANDAGSITASGAYATPTNDPGGRAVDLSMISSNSLEGIRVYKTVTPDMDAAVLGGTVNFDLREAKGKPSGAPLISLLSQGAYNNLISTYNNYKFVASAEQRFFDDRFGIFIQGIAQKQNLTSNQLGGTYWQPKKQDEPDVIVLGSLNLAYSPSEQKRYDGILTLDYRLPDGKLSLLNLVSHGKTSHETHSETYNLSNYGDNIALGTELSFNELDVITNILKYEQRIGSFKADVKLSNAYSDNHIPRGWRLVFSQLSAGTNKISNKLSPVKIAEEAKDLINLDKMYWQGNSIWSSLNKQNETQASVDLMRKFNLSQMISLTLKGGGQYRYTTRDYDFDAGFGSLYSGAAAGFRYDLVQALPWLTQPPYNFDVNGAKYFNIAGFYDPNMNFGKFLQGDYSIHSAVKTDVIDDIMDTIKSIGEAATQPANVPSYEPDLYSSIASDYSGHEVRGAEYLMGTFNIGPHITLISGVRYQSLKTSYKAPQFIGNADMPNPYPNPIKHTWVTHDKYHGYWLPNISLKYSPFYWLSVRSAYTTSLAYPDFNQAIPRIDVSSNSGHWAVWNNVALKPAYSNNFDFQVAVYNNEVGLFAVSPFLKRIDDLIFSQSTFITDPSRYPGLPDFTKTFKLDTYINNPHRVDIWGIESEWQTHFWYLPGPLSGLVLNINYTHIFSEATYPYTKTVLSPVYPFLPTYVDTTYTDRLLEQPKDVVNLSVGFDYKQFSILASMIYQAQVYRGTHFYNALRSDKTNYLRWDLSVKQGLPWSGLEVYFDLNNLNSEEDIYAVRGSGFPNSISNYGLTGDLGVRLRL